MFPCNSLHQFGFLENSPERLLAPLRLRLGPVVFMPEIREVLGTSLPSCCSHRHAASKSEVGFQEVQEVEGLDEWLETLSGDLTTLLQRNRILSALPHTEGLSHYAAAAREWCSELGSRPQTVLAVLREVTLICSRELCRPRCCHRRRDRGKLGGIQRGASTSKGRVGTLTHGLLTSFRNIANVLKSKLAQAKTQAPRAPPFGAACWPAQRRSDARTPARTACMKQKRYGLFRSCISVGLRPGTTQMRRRTE